jgi:hypothetical protein
MQSKHDVAGGNNLDAESSAAFSLPLPLYLFRSADQSFKVGQQVWTAAANLVQTQAMAAPPALATEEQASPDSVETSSPVQRR